ncbi:MAG: plastocyanin/azurin family copper-binding protein [Candidatus Nitrosocaldaceae archaeon]
MAEAKAKYSPFIVMALAFIVSIGVSIGYYQFFYLPYLNLKPVIPEAVLHPTSIAEVSIVEGAFNPEQKDNFIPKSITVQLEINNKVRWTNKDVIAHTVTSDNEYNDPGSGLFDSQQHEGSKPMIQPGGIFEFVFTQVGEYKYHCVPHPWMTGTVIVEKAKF